MAAAFTDHFLFKIGPVILEMAVCSHIIDSFPFKVDARGVDKKHAAAQERDPAGSGPDPTQADTS